MRRLNCLCGVLDEKYFLLLKTSLLLDVNAIV